MKIERIVWEGHKCLKFANGVIVGQSKVRAILDNIAECKEWLVELDQRKPSESISTMANAFARLSYTDKQTLLKALKK